MPEARTPRLRIRYERAGAGPPVLFLPGSGTSVERRPNPLDGPLPDRFDVALPDLRGAGGTEAPPGDWSTADLADDAAALLDHLGWDRCAVVGNSFGGMVAQELALAHPRRVGRLVLVATSSGGAGGSSFPLHELSDLPPAERAERGLAVVDTRGLAPELAEGARRAAQAPPSPGARQQLEARRRHDAWDRLGAIAVPTLVCGGRHDGIAPVANQEALAGRIPGARLALFEAGHLVLTQDPAAYEAITAFLGEG